MPRKFVILFTGRVGSSHLVSLIDSHPDATCKGELIWHSKGKPLDQYLPQFFRGAEAVAGFKMGWDHFYAYPDAIDYFEQEQFSVIVLTRENKLDQFISMRAAQISGKWTSQHGSTDVEPFPVDPAAFLAAARSWTVFDAMMYRAAQPMPRLTMTYEELTQAGPDRALTFLGLDADKPVSSRFTRQRSGSQRRLVSNYAALKEALGDSEFWHCCVD